MNTNLSSSDIIVVFSCFGRYALTIFLPQSGNYLPRNNVIGVLTYHPQHKIAVIPQIVITEASKFLPVFLPVVLFLNFETFFEVMTPVCSKQDPQPVNDAEDIHNRKHRQPEPYKYVELLVEDVDG